MMKRLCFALVALSAAAVSSAAIDFQFTLGTAYKTVAQPTSGTVTLTWSGTINILLPKYDIDNFTVDFPGLTGAGPYLSFDSFDAGFLAYVNGSNAGVNYSGNLFSFTVDQNTAVGDYFYNSLSNSGLSEAIAEGTDGNHVVTDSEFFGASVTPAVPEPASMAALGLGVAALIRRRRSSK